MVGCVCVCGVFVDKVRVETPAGRAAAPGLPSLACESALGTDRGPLFPSARATALLGGVAVPLDEVVPPGLLFAGNVLMLAFEVVRGIFCGGVAGVICRVLGFLE